MTDDKRTPCIDEIATFRAERNEARAARDLATNALDNALRDLDACRDRGIALGIERRRLTDERDAAEALLLRLHNAENIEDDTRNWPEVEALLRARGLMP